MSFRRSPTLRELRESRSHPRPTSKRAYAWIDEDPDLAPAPRKEAPLSAWT